MVRLPMMTKTISETAASAVERPSCARLDKGMTRGSGDGGLRSHEGSVPRPGLRPLCVHQIRNARYRAFTIVHSPLTAVAGHSCPGVQAECKACPQYVPRRAYRRTSQWAGSDRDRSPGAFAVRLSIG
jgi:hypothetical protein